MNGAVGSCSWDSSSQCYCCGPGDEPGCNKGTWVYQGSGCHGSLSCDKDSGYSISCPAGKTCNSYTSSCQTCGNSSITCFKIVPTNPPDPPCQCTCNDNSSHCGSYTSTTLAGGGSTCLNGQACTSYLCTGTKTCTSCQTCSGDACVTDPSKVVNGGWSTSWSPCSSCSQSRTCNNPAPACGGAPCVGSSSSSCGYSSGSNGSCGLANGGSFATTPTIGLCSSGSSSSVISLCS